MSFDAIKMGRISKAQKEKVRIHLNYKSQYRKKKYTIKHIKVKRIIEYDLPTDSNTKSSKKSNEKRILTPKQMRLAKEIREKCYPAYIEFSRDMVDTYQRAIDCIKTNKPEPLDPDIIDQEKFQLIWPKFLNKMGQNTKQLVLYIKSLPGLSQLDIDDLTTLFDKHS